MKVIINPSLAAIKDFNYGNWIKRLVEANVKAIHFDIMDGYRTNNYGLNLNMLNLIPTNIRVDLHVMVINPIAIIKNIPYRENTYIHTHISMVENFIDFINEVKKYNFKPGITFDLDCDFKFDQKIVDSLDFFNFMSVAKIGGTDALFDEKVFDNFAKFKANYKFKENSIFEVDGSVRENHIHRCKQTFNTIVVGSLLYNFEDIQNRIIELEK